MKIKHIPSDFLYRVRYEPDSGELFWVQHPNHCSKNGEPVKSSASTGYKRVYLRNEGYLQHRVAYFLMTGEQAIGDIDHINGDIRDNRWENLRLVTHQVNMCNRKKHVGVNRRGNVWRAYFQNRHLYSGPDLFEAWCARKRAEISTR